MKTARSLVQSALGAFNLRLVRRNRFDRLCSVLDGRVAASGWLVRDIPAWHEPVCGEPGVNLALRDLVRPGDTCFDVGAFDGALAQVMARLTGPRGLVCAFEANPGMLAKLTNNCSANALANVHLVHAVVWHTTGEWATMLVPPGVPAAATVTGTVDVDTTEAAIPTLALDDYAARHGLCPNVVKMDIEGAEHHALAGFADTLRRHKPHLVLEQRTHEVRALDIVRAAGYEVFDCGSYEDVRAPNDFPAGSSVRNVVCVHRDRLHETAYAARRPKRLVKEYAGADLQRPGARAYELEVRLPPGRYVVEIAAAAESDATLAYEVSHDRALRGKWHVVAWWFLANARDLPFHLHRETTVTIRFAQIEGSGAARLERLKLFAVDGVTPVPPLGEVV
jgi:FkbM family methyltransferase